MDTSHLHIALEELRRAFGDTPPRILRIQPTPPCGLAVLLEGTEADPAPRVLQLEVDPDCATAHLERAREGLAPASSARLGGIDLLGAQMDDIVPTAHPRVLRVSLALHHDSADPPETTAEPTRPDTAARAGHHDSADPPETTAARARSTHQSLRDGSHIGTGTDESSSSASWPARATLIVEWTGRGGNLRLLDDGDRVLWTRRASNPRAGAPYELPAAPPWRSPASRLREAELDEWIEIASRATPALTRATVLAVLHEMASDAGTPASGDSTTSERTSEPDPDTVALHIGEAARRSETIRFRTPDPSRRSPDSPAADGPRSPATAGVANTSPEPHPGPPALHRFPPTAAVPIPFTGHTRSAGDLGLPAAAILTCRPNALQPFEAGPRTTSVLALLESAYRINRRHRAETEIRTLYRATITKESKRLMRARGKMVREREGEGEASGPELRKFGQAILAHLTTIRKGDRELVCEDWDAEDAPPLHIPLDPAKPPTEVAEEYFRHARRWEKGEPIRRRRIQLIDEAVAALSMLQVKLEDASGALSIEKVEDWLQSALGTFYRPLDSRPDGAAIRDWEAARETGPVFGPARAPGAPGVGAGGGRARADRPQTRGRAAGAGRGAEGGASRGKAKHAASRFAPRTFRTRDGWTVVVGRSNEENDYVTHRLARPDDYWFHAHGVPGSHVVLRRDGRKDNPSAKTIEEAASIAAFFSKARSAGKAPVIYTLKKYVRKPRKAKAGLALCTRERMVMVVPKDPSEGKAPEWMED